MTWQYTPYSLPLFGTTAATAALAVYGWHRRHLLGARPLVLLAAALSLWSLSYACELGSDSLAAKLFWSNVMFVGITAAAAAWLTFALQYTGRGHWLTRRNVTLLAIQPVLVTLLAWTNDLHHLFRTGIGMVPLADERTLALNSTYGIAFWLHGAYCYVLLLIGTFLLARTFYRAPRFYRRQTGVMLIGALTPWFANMLYLAAPGAFFHLDPTPFAFSLSSLAVAWGLFHFRLLDIVPVAREALIEEMSDGIIVLDARDRILDLNPAARQILGSPHGELVGSAVTQAVPGWPPREATFPDQARFHAEIRLTQGELPRVFDLRITPLYDRQARLTGRMATLHDITARKQSEEEREKLIRELDAFDATVAHDLKNPLSLVTGMAEMLRDDLEDLSPEETKSYLDEIVQHGRKMGRIVDALLSLARLHDTQIQIGPLNMADVVAEAQQQLAAMIRAQQAEIHLPDSWPVVLGYSPWIEEVWVNYLSNALKYSGQPSRLRLGAGLRADGMVRFWVRDNGPGLTPEQQARLFTPFTRIDHTQAIGHGLGLSIVRRIVERLGGQVGVESPGMPGQGSLFWFTLPVAPPETAGQQERRSGL